MGKIVKMPNGDKVRFPDDMPDEEIRALIEDKFPDFKAQVEAKRAKATSDATAQAQRNVDDANLRNIPLVGPVLGLAKDAMTGTQEGGAGDSYVGQGLSGINEGIANAISLPANLANAALSVGPAVSNALLGTDFKGPNYIPDPGKDAKALMETTGAIQKPSQDVGKQVVRRVGQEVGAAATLGPTRPVASAVSAVGSGLGAATAEQLAPGNDAAEFAGQVIGGLATGGATALARKGKAAPAAPSADDLEVMKRDAYKAADNLGVRYTPQAYQNMTSKVESAVKADNISPTRHPKAFSFVEDMKTRFQNGMSLTEMDQLRQEVRRDLLKSPDAAERHFGDLIKDEIDDFIAKAGAKEVSSGSGADAAKAITTARELNTRWRKTELIEDALYAADLKTASTGSGGNVNNAIRQAFRSILTSQKKRAAFTADEIADMEKVVKQGKGEELLRLVGKLSPGGNGLMAALGIGGTMVNPLAAAIPVAGMVAKGLADRGTIGRANALRDRVASGAARANALPTARTSDAVPAAALAAGTANRAANDNEEQTRRARRSGAAL